VDAPVDDSATSESAVGRLQIFDDRI